MALGAFSNSLNVSDIAVSLSFYEKLGFTKLAGELDQGWLILTNDGCVIGLFQGMLERNTMTFNPGWDQNGQPVGEFKDIRELQAQYKADGLEILNEVDESSKGPASFIVVDPDGNPILFDQHV
ncbi:MAG: VOC family protein [Rhizobiaceae bacterium]|nr:VOC family protein [Rhizobiaceae bacterium]